MKKITKIVAATLLMVSCGTNAKRINDASDLKQLADEFVMDLEMDGIESVCTEAGLKEVEKFLEGKSEGVQQQYVLNAGAYLGECLIQTYGGEWIEHEPGVWGVKFEDDLVTFPIGKVQKFVEDPTGDSFASLYASVPMIIELNKKKP